MSAISDFYDPLRIILGDDSSESVFMYSDDKLLSAVKTVFRFGRGPEGYSVSGASISPDVPDGNDFARIAYESALLLVGGEETISYQTRALTVRRAGDRKRELMTQLRMKMSDLDAGYGFATSQDFIVWLRNWRSCLEPITGGDA